MTILTLIRAPLFRDAETLYVDAADRQPLSGMAQACALRLMFHHRAGIAERKGDQNAADDETGRAFYYFLRATVCPDISNFREQLEMRARMADLLLSMAHPVEARRVLDGWLPPPHLRARDASVAYTDAQLKTTYQPGTLAFAWLIGGAKRA